MEFITVTVDKSHIITIGEKLYTESIEFIRELVNNAYDADATLVDIIITDDAIEIRDNGAGMDREGLMQYFNIGSQYKLKESHSPVYNRTRIGQFGIGKFASLAACKRFEIITKKKTTSMSAAPFCRDRWVWRAISISPSQKDRIREIITRRYRTTPCLKTQFDAKGGRACR